MSEAASPPDRELPPDMRRTRTIQNTDPASLTDSAQDWLLSGEAAQSGFAELLDGTMSRLAAAGFVFDRATLHIGTLHPQLLGFRAAWWRDRGVSDEVQVHQHVRETDDYTYSPLRPVIESGTPVRFNPQDPDAIARYRSMGDLVAQGLTDYTAFTLPRVRGRYAIMTVATRDAGGFAPPSLAALNAVAPALALNADILSLSRIAENVLTAYLGPRSGRRVLAGDISRGSGETIDAIVWMSDMRDFTGLSDRLPGHDLVRVLNAWFERLALAVSRHGGEVLKFIGDGMLAIFPVRADEPDGAAMSALGAAREALAAIDMLNGVEGDALSIDGDWRPLGMAVALHRGSVFYGNVGAADRVDFTVTGPAVNLAARVEPLAKSTGRRILLTESVASLIAEPTERLGAFELRGVAQPVAVVSARETA